MAHVNTRFDTVVCSHASIVSLQRGDVSIADTLPTTFTKNVLVSDRTAVTGGTGFTPLCSGGASSL